MSTHSDIQKTAAVKACPKCHRLLKKAFMKSKDMWVCIYCGTKVEAEVTGNG